MKHDPVTNAQAHSLVGRTAKELAAEFYEQVAKHNKEFWKANLSQNSWAQKNWPHFIDEARGALGALLSSHTTDEEQKDEIAEALIADHQLRGTRLGVKQYRAN